MLILVLVRFFSIVQEIYISYNGGFKVHGVFLDISKFYDNVWQGVTVRKVKNGISGKLLMLDDFNAPKI